MNGPIEEMTGRDATDYLLLMARKIIDVRSEEKEREFDLEEIRGLAKNALRRFDDAEKRPT